MKKLDNIQDLIKFSVDLTPSTFAIFKDRVEIFVESNIKNERKRDEYLEQLKRISIKQWVYYSSYPWINEEEATQNNREASNKWFHRWIENMTRFLLKLKWFLESDLNKVEKIKWNPVISAGTHIQAWGDVIIWDYNKNNINELEKFVELLNTWNHPSKTEIFELLEEFKETNNRSKLVDIFDLLGNSASAWSLLIALSTLIR